MGSVAVNAMQAVPSSTVINNNAYTLNVTSTSPTEPIVDDFYLLKAVAGS